MQLNSITFEWDKHNEEKLWERHQVTAEEAEEAFFNRNLVLTGKKQASQEKRYYLYGATDPGRYLFIVFTLKDREVARVISARSMQKSELSWFKKRQ